MAKGVEACTIWPAQAAAEMGKMVEQCTISDQLLSGIAGGKAALPYKAGSAAEVLHAETFNLDAILKNKDLQAFTDRHANSPLSRNHPAIDVVVMREGKPVQSAQLKYYADAEKTANALRETRDGAPYYKEADTFIGPSDQLQGIKDAARKTELREAQNRPHVADAARDVQKKTTDTLSVDGVKSKPMTKKEAEVIARQDEQGKGAHRRIQSEYKNASTLKHTARAAGSAALVTTVIAGSINTLQCLDAVQKGTMSRPDAVRYILRNTAIAAADSALKAGAATAAVSLSARHLPQLFSGSMLQSTLTGGAIGGAAICAVDLAECLVLVAAGEMTVAELEARTGKNVFQTGAGVIGSSIGATLGAVGGPPGMLVGSIVGGMITSLAMTIAIENHIEMPYRDLITQTTTLAQSQSLLHDSLDYLAEAQTTFAQFRVGLQLSEDRFAQTAAQIDDLGADMRRALDRI